MAETCEGLCSVSCSTDCYTSCSSTCSGGCTGTCSGGCTGTCSALCASGCADTCSAACSMNCTYSCLTHCTSTCSTFCTTTCSNSCGAACSSSCSSACTGECSGTCSNSCGAACSSSCSSACTGECSGTCSNACGAACSSSCSSACTGECSGTCSNACGAACSSSCSSACTGECSGTCSNACGAACSSSCSSACTGECSGTCSNACGAACSSACTGSCDGTCSITCTGTNNGDSDITGEITSDNTQIYFGPDVNIYPVIDTINAQIINILWKESTWYYIECNESGSSLKQRGYISEEHILNVSGDVSSKVHDIIGDSVVLNSTTYSGPGTNYVTAGSVGKAEIVSILNDVSNGYRMIEYRISTTQKKRGYVEEETQLNGFNISNFKTYVAGEILPSTFTNYEGWKVTQGFNDHFTDYRGHLAYDLNDGPTEDIKPVFDGNVVYVDKTDTVDNGCIVVIEHTLHDKPFYSSYSHLKFGSLDTLYDEWIAADKVLPVTTTKKLGEMGGTGGLKGEKDKFGPHLHLMIYELGTATSYSTNPAGYAEGGEHTKYCETVDSNFNGIYYTGDKSYGRKIYETSGFISTQGSVMLI